MHYSSRAERCNFQNTNFKKYQKKKKNLFDEPKKEKQTKDWWVTAEQLSIMGSFSSSLSELQ